MKTLTVQQMTCTRLPTPVGQFQLCLYRTNQDDKEHLALIMGEVADRENVWVRIHSECFTGDVLGSLRCDCGEQLQQAMTMIAARGAGIILYLRQEGRGIGLLNKLRAYNLQDEGYDTVDANLMLGHQADERDYTVAALMLRHLGVRSIHLLTNNPRKIEDLRALGLPVTNRISLQPTVNQENASYLNTKVARMRHLLDLEGAADQNGAATSMPPQLLPGLPPAQRPFVTLTYAQSLDGSIAAHRGQPLPLSGPEAMRLTHQLRAAHQAILVGIGTLLADDPRLSVRLSPGTTPRPVVVDSQLRFPLSARLLAEGRRPIIATTTTASAARQTALEMAGARVVRMPASTTEKVDLTALLAWLRGQGYASLMVEGGATMITEFLRQGLVDRLVVTVAPVLVGGLNAVASLSPKMLLQWDGVRQFGDDVVFWGKPVPA
ncbi:MAG: GTP cyclohydrolase II [Ardenticatenales bacterium]|nr:GTP cyclohydrolase II [Ardenticatenales bacterium]